MDINIYRISRCFGNCKTIEFTNSYKRSGVIIYKHQLSSTQLQLITCFLTVISTLNIYPVEVRKRSTSSSDEPEDEPVNTDPQSIGMAVAAAAPVAASLSQKTHDSVGAADLEKVTDYAPEKEISGDIGKVICILYNTHHNMFV